MTPTNQDTPQEGGLRQVPGTSAGGPSFYETRLVGGPCDGQTALVHPGQEATFAAKIPSLKVSPISRIQAYDTIKLHLYTAKHFRNGLNKWVEYHYEGGE